jgi:hypothetical protein
MPEIAQQLPNDPEIAGDGAAASADSRPQPVSASVVVPPGAGTSAQTEATYTAPAPNPHVHVPPPSEESLLQRARNLAGVLSHLNVEERLAKLEAEVFGKGEQTPADPPVPAAEVDLTRAQGDAPSQQAEQPYEHDEPVPLFTRSAPPPTGEPD